MEQKARQYSQLWDDGINAGIIGKIGLPVFSLLAVLAARMDKNGQCYPSRDDLSRKIGKSVRTIEEIIEKAKKTSYRGEPVLKVHQIKSKVNGKWLYGSNMYTISKPIRDDLINRYQSVGGKSLTEDNKTLSVKSSFPRAGIPYAKNIPTNDNHLVNKILINDMVKSLSNKFSFKGIGVGEFEKGVDSYEKSRCLEMAQWLGEKNMNFILSALHDKECGIAGLEWAFGVTKEDFEDGKARDIKRLFNFYVQKYKEEKTND
ncbi:helix-turn-helix domain-containing protein [Candidatus Falkowbacteria bacterium]|nr:helix-turn-helix domain-containing protein [Candidatus Falkowbacteria bacterium]